MGIALIQINLQKIRKDCMETVTAEDILLGCPLLTNMSQAVVQRLAEKSLLRRYEAGEVVFSQGDACPGMFIVGSGRVRVYKIAPQGKEHVLHMVGPGGTFAEVAAIGEFACPAWAQALEPTTCLLLPTVELARMLREDSELSRQMLLGMALWVRHLVNLLEDITLRDAAGRVARYLLEEADARDCVVLPSLKKHLASHLNLTSETLSRTLRRMEEAELIGGREEQTIFLLNRPGLTEVARGIGPII